MNRDEFEKVVEETIASTAKLLIEKGAEYAGNADRLSNFKRGSALIGVTPLQVALIYASKHFDAISTYIRNDATGGLQILSEPIEGRFDDLINYCYLMKALIKEARENEAPPFLGVTKMTITPYANVPLNELLRLAENATDPLLQELAMRLESYDLEACSQGDVQENAYDEGYSQGYEIGYADGEASYEKPS